MLARTFQIGLILGLLVLSGCAAKGSAEGGDSASAPSVFYVDANLGFAIKHPQNWQRSRPGERQEHPTTIWSPPAGYHQDLSLTVTALTPEEAVGGFGRLLEIFRQGQPAFTVGGNESLDLPDGAARRVIGTTPNRSWLLLLVTARRHVFILTASAPSADFDANRGFFDDLLESFRILESP